jgi:hypothetical protein
MKPAPTAVTTPLAMNQPMFAPVFDLVVVVRAFNVLRVVSSEQSLDHSTLP